MAELPFLESIQLSILRKILHQQDVCQQKLMNNKLQNTHQIVKVIWQIVCNSSNKNTHIWESLHIFQESTYKLFPWPKKFNKKYTVHHLLVHDQEFQYSTDKCIILNVAGNTISISHQNSFVKTLFTHFVISQKISFLFSLHAELTQSFSSALEESVPRLRHCWCLFQVPVGYTFYFLLQLQLVVAS